ncbi:hypothetical protein [Thermomonospora cellulosilytica]|uniref:Uncharacterized protein n=1 Tax=Thermomonospora cellulosilytica TaxID=1411118 RepID=A0A7W3N0K7_9ACTN|nr:hypothetical protein [Thermomonospora cellulosilytica]MBA9005284.1 hypothetical protein [Thermomonospora cellulosilytica]
MATEDGYFLGRRPAGVDLSDHTAELPWPDVERAFLIAVNRIPGDLWTGPERYAWRVVTPTFSEFAAKLGLLASP